MMKLIKSFLIFFFAIAFISCISTENSQIFSEQPTDYPGFTEKVSSVEMIITEIMETIQVMDEEFSLLHRDIDSYEWLMDFANYSAGKDLFIVESLHRNLKYQPWNQEQKKQFSELILADDHGLLSEVRNEYYEELKYLIKHSRPLLEYPWFLPSLFDSYSEFSYWYLMYNLKSMDPLWVDNNILPGMLALIPLDEITPVTYLWLRSPESLVQMDQEIFKAGYPWTILYHLNRINSELIELIDSLFPEGESPLQDREGVFI